MQIKQIEQLTESIGKIEKTVLSSAREFLPLGELAQRARSCVPSMPLPTPLTASPRGGVDQRIPNTPANLEVARLIQDLNRMMDRLETSFRQATRFSADASHELKTPPASMQGKLEDALQSAAAGSAEQQPLSNLLEEIQRLNTIPGSLLLRSAAILHGYCPGTGVAATATGSLHVLVGVGGVLVGEGILYALEEEFGWRLAPPELVPLEAAISAFWSMSMCRLRCVDLSRRAYPSQRPCLGPCRGRGNLPWDDRRGRPRHSFAYTRPDGLRVPPAISAGRRSRNRCGLVLVRSVRAARRLRRPSTTPLRSIPKMGSPIVRFVVSGFVIGIEARAIESLGASASRSRPGEGFRSDG